MECWRGCHQVVLRAESQVFHASSFLFFSSAKHSVTSKLASPMYMVLDDAHLASSNHPDWCFL